MPSKAIPVQKDNSDTNEDNDRGSIQGGGRRGGNPTRFSRFSPFFRKIHPKNLKGEIIFHVLPHFPLSFREVTPLYLCSSIHV